MKIGKLKFTFTRAPYNVVVGSEKLAEAKLVSALDIWNQQRARAVFLRYIDGHAKIDAGALQSDRVAIYDVEAVIELRKLVERAQQGLGDHVRVRRFAAIVFLKILIDEAAVLVEQLYWNASLGSCGWN